MLYEVITPVAKQLQTPGTFRLVQTEAGVCLHLSGDWTLPHYRRLRQAIDKLGQQAEASIDCAQLQALDTAGAALLGRFLGAERLQALAKSTSGLAPERRALLQAVGKALDQPEEPVPKRDQSLLAWVARLGEIVITSYSIHYTKLYDSEDPNPSPVTPAAVRRGPARRPTPVQ